MGGKRLAGGLTTPKEVATPRDEVAGAPLWALLLEVVGAGPKLGSEWKEVIMCMIFYFGFLSLQKLNKQRMVVM